MLAALLLTGCAKDPVRPLADPVRWGTGNADVPLAWSRDGQWIAFRRMLPSSYGPRGMYVVHRTGAVVRYAYGPADMFFPREASFSPDGRFIAAVDSWRRLIIVNLQTLEVRRPISTYQVWFPDWSPDGRSILYMQNSPGGPDSAGLMLFDVAAGTRRPLRGWGSEPVLASYACWSPDGRLIAMSELASTVQALAAIGADGTGHRFLIPPADLQTFSAVSWYRSPGGAARVLFWKPHQPGAGPYLINPDGTGLTPFPHRIQSEGYLSPTGEELVKMGPDPQTHFFVLYVGRVDDVTDLALRQVTRYVP